VIFFKGFAERDDAFGDLGVSRNAVEPIAP